MYYHFRYVVKHEQKAIEEVDYTVRNIATDLRDGLSLTRLVEIMSETAMTNQVCTF